MNDAQWAADLKMHYIRSVPVHVCLTWVVPHGHKFLVSPGSNFSCHGNPAARSSCASFRVSLWGPKLINDSVLFIFFPPACFLLITHTCLESWRSLTSLFTSATEEILSAHYPKMGLKDFCFDGSVLHREVCTCGVKSNMVTNPSGLWRKKSNTSEVVGPNKIINACCN